MWKNILAEDTEAVLPGHFPTAHEVGDFAQGMVMVHTHSLSLVQQALADSFQKLFGICLSRHRDGKHTALNQAVNDLGRQGAFADTSDSANQCAGGIRVA